MDDKKTVLKWSGMLKEFERLRDAGCIPPMDFRTFLDRFVAAPSGREYQTTAIQLATALPDLDFEKAYAALKVPPQECREAISKMTLSSSPKYWTLPMYPFVRKEKKKEIPLLTPNRIGQALREAGVDFTSYWHKDLDTEVTKNDRCPYL